MEKISAFLELFQKGKGVANPEAWKTQQNVTASLVAVLSAGLVIAKVFGYDFNIDQETLGAVCGGLGAAYGIYNLVLTTITTKKIGTAPKPE